MTLPLALLLLSACSRLPGCAEAPAPPAPIAAPAPTPTQAAWPHAWSWAAVVYVQAEAGAAVQLGGTPAQAPAEPAAETPAEPAAETPAEPAAETPAEPASPLVATIVRDALAPWPVSVWTAPPGARLDLPGLAPDLGGQAQSWTLPADAADGAWLVATDRGVHRVEWAEGDAVREIEVALGLQPWRVILAVGLGRELGAARDADTVQERLREQGVFVREVDPAVPASVPFADLPFEAVDVPAVLAGAGTGFILATPGKAPRLVTAEQPVQVLREASTYFGLELVPSAPAANGQKGGKAARPGAVGKAGKGGKAGRPVGKIGKGKRPVRPGQDGGQAQ
ncbi:hypothetical protein L6R53_30030 [Myxococcota bacterium]|nr:hypothetical protein [Myxococcota bacterium]